MTVGVGVVGAGVISSQYLENLTRCPDLRVLMVADLDVERAASRAAEFGIEGWGSVDGLLAHDEIEIVVNLTIPAAHVPVTLAALDAGKHVWTEKPLALDRAGARRVLDTARDKGLRVACAPDTMLGAGFQTARRVIEEGAIGTPWTALAQCQTPGPENWHPAPEFLFQTGGGPHLDMGPYYLTALVLLFGPVARVTAAGGRARETRIIGSGPRAGTEFEVTVPTTVSALVEFVQGGSAQVMLSFDSALRRAGVLEISGVRGAAVLPDPNRFDGATLLYRLDDEEPETRAPQGHMATRGTGVVELARAIRLGVPERASGELAYHVLDVLLAMAESLTAGTPMVVASTAGIPPPLPADWSPYHKIL